MPSPISAAALQRPSLTLEQRRHWELTLFACLPVVLTTCLVIVLARNHQLAFDFRREYWVAGSKLLSGTPLYGWTRAQFGLTVPFPYPPLTALLFAPVSLLPAAVVSPIACVAGAGCALGALRLLGVRDWRVYGLVMMWGPVVAGWQSANLSLTFVLALALIWRYRDRPLVAGVIAGLMLALKPFAWPVALWLLVTRRTRATVIAAITAAVATAVSFALVGFSQIHAYIALDGRVTNVALDRSYSAVALLMKLGLGHGPAYAGFVLLAASLVVCLVLAARRDERTAMLVCVLAMLAASPVVWTHYLTLLIVPLAILRPRLSIEWALPLLLWICPEGGADALQVMTAWVVGGAIAGRLVVGLLRHQQSGPERTAEVAQAH